MSKEEQFKKSNSSTFKNNQIDFEKVEEKLINLTDIKIDNNDKMENICHSNNVRNKENDELNSSTEKKTNNQKYQEKIVDNKDNIKNLDRESKVKVLETINKLKNSRVPDKVTNIEALKYLGWLSCCNNSSFNPKKEFIHRAVSVLESKMNINNYINLFYEVNMIKKLLINLSFSLNSSINFNSQVAINKDSNNQILEGVDNINRLFSIIKFIFPTSYSTETFKSAEKILTDYNNSEINQEYWTNYLIENDFIKMLESPENGKFLSREEKGLFAKNYLDSLL
jgi:hypothetical protein